MPLPRTRIKRHNGLVTPQSWLSRENRYTFGVVFKIHEPVAIVQFYLQNAKHGETQKARDFGSKATALPGKVKCDHVHARLPQVGKS